MKTKYNIDDIINDLKVIQIKDDQGYTLYGLKCKCGRKTLLYESDLPKKNCGQCNRSIPKFIRGRPEMETEEYKRFRRACFARDKGCIVCRAKKGVIVHHLNAWSWSIRERYDPRNAVVICGDFGCRAHFHFHNLFGKGRNTKGQFEHFLNMHFNKSLKDIGLL